MEICIPRRNFTVALAIIVKSTCIAQSWLIRQVLPMNSEVSKAGLQKQLLRAAVLRCFCGVGQSRSVLLRRKEDMGRNSQVKAEAEVISERTKVFRKLFRKEKQSRWEKDQRSTCAAV